MTEPRRIDAADMALQILRTELNELKEERAGLGDPCNWTGAILRLVIDNKIAAFERQLEE